MEVSRGMKRKIRQFEVAVQVKIQLRATKRQKEMAGAILFFKKNYQRFLFSSKENEKEWPAGFAGTVFI